MIYKIYDQLSGYLIAPDGTAVDKESGQAIPFNKTNTGFQAKLTTDEQIGLIHGKRKPVMLVRRFTREELLKMYERSKNVFMDNEADLIFTKQSIISENMKRKRIESGIPEPVGVLDLVKESKSKCTASKDPEHVNNVEKAMIDMKTHMIDSLNEFNQKEIASKRVVKAKPKAHKSLTQKVRKAIKEVAEAKQAMKIPFFRIDGVEYQSARSASKALGVAVNTVLKRAKSNKDGWFYIEA